MQKNPNISCVINAQPLCPEIDIVVKVYQNKIFIVATSYKKFGALVLVRQGERLKEFDTATYNATALFGAGSDKQEESILAAAKYIAQSIDIDRNLLLSIALSTYDKKVLDSVIAAIKKFKTW